MSRKLVLTLGLLPKKRTSAEGNDDDDEQRNEDSDALFLKENNAKRARLDSFRDTTLQDLPNELLECILVEAVAMEVKDQKLIRRVWKDKADLIINRLKPVSSRWTSILSSNVFRNKVHKLLDGTAQEKIRLEVLSSTTYTQLKEVKFITSLNDEIFMLEERNQSVVIKVYNRDNMAKVTDVIGLPQSSFVKCMTGCNVSNCVYVGLYTGSNALSVLHISRVGDQFNVSPWISDHKLKVYMMSVCTNGNLLLLSLLNGTFPNPGLLCMYNANGSLQHEMILPQDIDAFNCRKVLQKSNGNWIIVYLCTRNERTNLFEIDESGSVVRRYESSAYFFNCVNFADIHGRIMITNKSFGQMELLDSEFNLLGIYSLHQYEGKFPYVYDVHYVSERNEIVRARVNDYNSGTHYGLTIFRFTEE